LGLKFASGLKPISAPVQPDALQQIDERHNPRNNLAIKFSVLSLSLLEHGARAIASHLEVFSHTYGRLLAATCSCSFYAVSMKAKAFWRSTLVKRGWVTPATVRSVYSLQNSFPI
jgi:hypothetical protein